MGVLHDLSEHECRAHLIERQVGRAAVVAPDGPHIIPVNYSVVDEAIVFRTSPFTLLATHGRDAVIAFEIDHFDEVSHTGWSVLARGRTEVVLDSRQIEHIRRIWEPTPWAGGVRTMFVRLTIRELSGRRVGDTAPVSSW